MADQNCVTQQETPIESLDSHTWLNRGALRVNKHSINALKNSFNLEPDSTISLQDLALYTSTLLEPVQSSIFMNFQRKSLHLSWVSKGQSWAWKNKPLRSKGERVRSWSKVSPQLSGIKIQTWASKSKLSCPLIAKIERLESWQTLSN